MENLQSYKSAIITKLKSLEKKLTISYRSSSDADKRYELRQYLTRLENLFRKIELEIIEWEDLLQIGVSKRSVMELIQDNTPAKNVPTENAFPMISKIPELEILDEDVHLAQKINGLFSIIEYVNINYQTIFAQKILLSASKTNSVRVLFYNQYQDIFHIFNSYKELSSISSKSEDFVKMLNKEYLQLLKTTYNFFTSIQNYIELIAEDDTFSATDFLQNIITEETNSCIANNTLKEALEECHAFIDEATSYIQNENRDIFDQITIGQELNSKE